MNSIFEVEDILFQIFDLLVINDLHNLSAIYLNIKNILKKEVYWKHRLNNKFGLKTKDSIDYEFVCTFLDDGRKTIYNEALDKGYVEIVKLLLDNGIVEHHVQDELLNITNLQEINLLSYKNLSYDKFIDIVSEYNNTNWNQIIYTKSVIILRMYIGEEIYLVSDKFFTKGELLYQVMLNLKDKPPCYCTKIKLNKIINYENEFYVTVDCNPAYKMRSYFNDYYGNMNANTNTNRNLKQITL